MADRPHQPGSQDDHPPKLLYPDNFRYCIVIRPDDHFEVYRGGYRTSTADLLSRLHRVLAYFEGQR